MRVNSPSLSLHVFSLYRTGPDMVTIQCPFLTSVRRLLRRTHVLQPTGSTGRRVTLKERVLTPGENFDYIPQPPEGQRYKEPIKLKKVGCQTD